MSKGFHRDRQEDIESVVAVQFSIFSDREIEERSVVEVTSQATYEGSEPKTGGLFDARMGVLDNGKKCLSCGQTNHGCPGHFGHFRLTRPVYYIQFLPTIQNVLRCVCIRCGKLKIDKSFHTNLVKRKGQTRWKEVTKLCQSILRCGQEAENGCGAIQPFKIERKGIASLVAHFKTDAVASGAKEALGDAAAKKETKEMPLEVEEVHRLFRRISDDDVDFMGLSRHWCRPDWMICTVLPIPPPQVRPSVVQDNNTRSEDDLTHKLSEIIKSDQVLQKKIEDGASENVIAEYTNVLQYHIATLVDNQIPGVAPSAQRSGRPLKSIQQRIGSKEGRIRYNIQGKRVEFSARSVITPDPNISIEELGVPMEIATNLTFPDRVTQFNKTKLYTFVQNGADKWPGAKTIMRKDGRMISLKHVNTNEIVLYNGDVVNRHLIDGDIVLFNRQPTLHKMSMMAHRVKVLPYKTFRLNVLVTRPYNADFDGDEMNMHVPQSYEAAVELEEIAAIPHNVVSPRHAKPLIGTFQDSVVGSYRITRPTSRFNRREFMNLMMRNIRFDGFMPTPNEQGQYTGQQVISQLLPPLNISMGNKDDPAKQFIIDQGIIMRGQLTSGVYMDPGKGIVHILYNDYGPKETTMFLDSLQRVIEDYLVLNGFSVGISDLVADDKTTEGIKTTIEGCKKEIEELQLQVHSDLFENNTGKTNQQEFEDQAYRILNAANDKAQKAVEASLSSENRLVAMINSGSKGKWLNIAQMIACLGQQSIENKRVEYGFTDRTLPHYKKYDDGAEARGFVESSFIKGLTPQEFFFHAKSGREGLIDTAVKTADTGYIQRQLIKALEDFVVQHDGTVRDANMNVLQFQYGEDGIAATKIESQALPISSKLTEEQIKTTYGMSGVNWADILEEGVSRPANEKELIDLHVTNILKDQRMLVEKIHKNSGYGGDVKSPVNLNRLILNIKANFLLNPTKKTTLTPYTVLNRIDTILERTKSQHNRVWGALLRHYLSPHNLIVKERFTEQAFDALTELIVVTHMKSWVQPGEQVGIVAAQSIGEPSTQLTLNTFHTAGVATKNNVTTGIPRLREILKVTKNPKASSLTIPMKPEFNGTGEREREKAREIQQDLELTLLRHITNKVAIYWDPTDEATVIEQDREMLQFYKEMELDAAPKEPSASTEVKKDNSNPWLLRFELNREAMYNKNITMADVVFVIKGIYTSPTIDLVYSDYNAQSLIMRIRVTFDIEAGKNYEDYFNLLKKFENKMLNSCVIRGVPGIKAVTFRPDTQKVFFKDGKYQESKEYILDTDGSNYVRVMNHPAVDANRLYTTNIHDVMDILGLEAVRAILLSEIMPIFSTEAVNYRHLGILCDYITRSGRLMSVDRYGINTNEIGPLGKMSFEETTKIVMDAARFGEVDPVNGVSANIMMGQPFRGGTAFSQILLDDEMLVKLSKGLGPYEVEEDNELVDEVDDVDIDATAPCSTAQFQVNMIMPNSTKGLMSEEDIELVAL